MKGWLKRYGLEGMAYTYPNHLSGGQTQRVAMLRTLAAAECILPDEPFSALDEHVKRSMESELMEMLTDFHNPVVFVSHNRDEVYRLAGRIGSMERGVLSTVRDKKISSCVFMSVEQALSFEGCNNISEVNGSDKHHLFAVEWDSVFEVTDEQLEQTAMSMDGISHIGVFPQDIIISAGKTKTALAYADKNIIRIKDYKMIEELKSWEDIM